MADETEFFFNRRRYVKTLLYGYAVGILVVGLTSAGTKVNIPRLSVMILIIGFCINSMIWIFEYLFRRLVWRLPPLRQIPLHMIITAVGGVTGFVIGFNLSWLILRQRLPRFEIYAQPLIITLAVSLLAGFTMFLYVHLENRLRETVRETELAQQELTLARAIQERLLPPPELVADGFRATARNLPAQYVAGDFYDLILRTDGTLVAIVADVAGKGVVASLIRASVKSILPMIASAGTVEAIMRQLNEKLARELGRREFVALACALYDPANGRVLLANAGLPDPYVIRDHVATPVVAGGPRLPLGIKKSIDYECTSVDLHPGDRLLLLTDGLPEAETAPDQPLGYERLAEIVGREHSSLERLFAAIEAEATGARSDDWTAVMVERV